MPKLNIATIVEEADVGLSADGFDNFLMDDSLEELKAYSKALKKIKALRCSRVINELLAWVGCAKGVSPLAVAESDRSRADALWQAYCSASAAEDPRSLANNFGLNVAALRKPRIGDAFHVIVIDLKERCTAATTTEVWHSFQRELGELNPSTRGSALKSKETILDHIERTYGSPIEIRFTGGDALASSGDVGAKTVSELKRFFSGFFQGVSAEYLKVTWQ